MFTRIRHRRGAAIAVAVCAAFLSVSLVGPAVGAPSPLSVAKKALKSAKKATKTANGANKRSKSALTAAKAAGGTASAADSKASQALGAASAPDTAGPAAVRTNGGIDVPTDGSAVEDFASCPPGYLAVGGGVGVVADDGTPITDGIVVTESVLDPSGTDWDAAVKDTSGVPNRFMFVVVQCGKPSTVDFGAATRNRSR